MFELSLAPQDAVNEEQTLLIDFDQWQPVSLDGAKLSPAQLLSKLNEIGGHHGIWTHRHGRIKVCRHEIQRGL